MIASFPLLQDVEELLRLPPEKVLLKWMNFHLKKGGYKKNVSNFSSDLKVFVFSKYNLEETSLFCLSKLLAILDSKMYLRVTVLQHEEAMSVLG